MKDTPDLTRNNKCLSSVLNFIKLRSTVGKRVIINAVLQVRLNGESASIIPSSLIGIPTNVCVNNRSEDVGRGNQTTQDEPTIAIEGRNIVVSFNDTTLDGSGFCASRWLNYSTSSDFGHTFKDQGAIKGTTYGNSVTVSNRAGTFFCCTIAADPTSIVEGCQPPPIPMIGVARSDNNGQSFDDLVYASGKYPNSEYDFQDKPWLAVDNTGGQYNARLYLAWVRISNWSIDTSRATNQIRFVYSSDNGNNWSSPVDLSSDEANTVGHTGPTPVVGPDGKVYVVWLYPRLSQILITRSDDGGQTFTNPIAGAGPVQTISMIPQILNGGIGASSFPSISIDQQNGTIYVVYAGGNGQDHADIFLIKSTDNGRNWSSPIRVNDDSTSTDQWMPSVAVSSNGVVAVMYDDRRNDPNNSNIDVYLALSTDHGSSFLPNQRITTTSFPPVVNFDPEVFNQNYMGDYNHIIANGTSLFMVWGDNRDMIGSRHDPNIYFATLDTRDL